jgi:hypothetical protein
VARFNTVVKVPETGLPSNANVVFESLRILQGIIAVSFHQNWKDLVRDNMVLRAQAREVMHRLGKDRAPSYLGI